MITGIPERTLFTGANMRRMKAAIMFPLFVATLAVAQSGGTYQITQTVVASGAVSSGGSYSIENTGGQPVAGSVPTSGSFSLHIGFWTPELAPTAANVPISGRILTATNQGIRNVVVSLTDSSGATRAVKTGTFGYYRFSDVRVGEAYVLTVSSKRFVFSSPTRLLFVQDELADVDFISEPESWGRSPRK